jgi:threonine/homoserine/homoserine lactone efflux protein
VANIVFSYVLSFVGSLTPGTINLTVLQTGLNDQPRAAIRMAAAAAIVEYFYAWIAVRFEKLLTSDPVIFTNMQLIAAIVITVLGIITVLSASSTSGTIKSFSNSGFRKGIVLGILNPLAIPYWIGVTAYFKSVGWIDLSTSAGLHFYLAGVSLGVFTLLSLLTFGASKLSATVSHRAALLKRIPGYLMIALGIYAFVRYFMAVIN